MKGRSAAAPVIAGALVLVAVVGGSSPAAFPDHTSGSFDLLASAHATSAEPSVSDAAFDVVRVRTPVVEADAAALASSTCDGCVSESTTLQVVYGGRGRGARLDNVANAWAQECTACGSTALSVQVVVLRGRTDAAPNNRAVAVNAACDRCRTSALAFQVVLVADDAAPLGRAEMTDLQAWFDEQAAALRAFVVQPDSPSGTQTSPSPEPTATPTQSGMPTSAPTQSGVPSSEPTTVPPGPSGQPSVARKARRDAASALDELTALLTDALDADPVAADVEVGR